MKTYLIINQHYITNIIVADDDTSAAIGLTTGSTAVEIQELPSFPIIGKQYIDGEYIDVTQEPTVEI